MTTATAPVSRTAARPAAPAPAARARTAGDDAHAKIMAARGELAARMIERDDEIELVLTALVAGEHCLFVGPPGTGKSMLCDGAAELIDGGKFSYLMTKFTDPSEVLGPISLAELKAGRYVRVTAGKLPEAEIAFLDEIFKSSSAILNTLLKILNERTFDAGHGSAPVPLRLCVAASNEWPTGEGQQELSALFDRFLLRRTVKPIQSADGKRRLRFDRTRGAAPLTVRLTAAELDAARAEAAALPWAKDAEQAFDQIIRDLNREGVFPGDRREYKAVGVVQAAAWLDGATEVQVGHLAVLADVLWDSPEEQPKKAAEVVAKVANPMGFQINSLLVEVEQILAATDTKNLAAVTGAAQKLGEVNKKLLPMKGQPKGDKALAYVQDRVRALKASALEAMG